jgi:hypothetical protein
MEFRTNSVATLLCLPSPTNPTESAKPAHPTKPTEPIKANNPADPTNHTNPDYPTNPTDPTDPSDPTNPTPGEYLKTSDFDGLYERLGISAGASWPNTDYSSAPNQPSFAGQNPAPSGSWEHLPASYGACTQENSLIYYVGGQSKDPAGNQILLDRIRHSSP